MCLIQPLDSLAEPSQAIIKHYRKNNSSPNPMRAIELMPAPNSLHKIRRNYVNSSIDLDITPRQSTLSILQQPAEV